MARTTTRAGRITTSLSEEQWHELMRSLIDEPDAPGDEASENSLLQEVAGRDHAGGPGAGADRRSVRR